MRAKEAMITTAKGMGKDTKQRVKEFMKPIGMDEENDCKGKPSKSCKEMMIMKGKANSQERPKRRSMNGTKEESKES